MKAVILAGGFGKRLRPLTDERPKHLIEVGGKPILVRQFDWLRGHGIADIVLCTGFLKEQVMAHIGNGRRFGVKVAYVVEEEPLGKGGALLNAEGLLTREDKFLVVNGDVLTDLDPAPLITATDGFVGAVALVPLRSTYGVVDVDGAGRVLRFREKPVLHEYWLNAGVYCLTPEVFPLLADRTEIEDTAFPHLARDGKLRAVKYSDCFWKSIDTHKDIEEAEKELAQLGRVAQPSVA